MRATRKEIKAIVDAAIDIKARDDKFGFVVDFVIAETIKKYNLSDSVCRLIRDVIQSKTDRDEGFRNG